MLSRFILCLGLALFSSPHAYASFASPLAASDLAVRWDVLYDFLNWLSVIFFVAVIGAMIYFAIAYRHQKGHRSKYITGNHLLETIWIAVPTVLLMIIFAWGYAVYHTMAQAPSDAYEVKVIGRQWHWTFLYDNGRTSDYLFVPLNRPTKLVMSSQDVLHSMFIPNFRVKQDVVPGMYTSIWFEPKMTGKHPIYCAEYCGATHSGMLSWAIVLNDEQWQDFVKGKEFDEKDFGRAGVDLATAEKPITTSASAPVRPTSAGPIVTLAQLGKGLYESKGCTACHSVDGERKIGPTLKGLYGRTVELSDGTQVKADENYIRESIERPQARLVKGFQPVMPTFQGQVDEKDLGALIAFIRTLK